MNVLIIGSGGREHALAWKIKSSTDCESLYIAPGNAGTAKIGTNVEIAPTDFERITEFIQTKHIDLVVVGPEDPLAKGIRDHLELSISSGLLIVGPDRRGAQLESSKDFSKDFMQKNRIPTAGARTFNEAQLTEAREYLTKTVTPPYVIKADGLAAGKGVVITENLEIALHTVTSMLVDKQFGEAGSRVLVEEFLQGIEVSVFVLTDGKDYVILPEAKDYKRIGEGDTGPNTGGMGAVSPVPFADPAFMSKVKERVIKPTLEGLAAQNISYKGFLFIGLMNVDGNPYVIEYNVRMGDPETQAVLPRITSDFLKLLSAAADGSLAQAKMDISPNYSATVVIASKGYPQSYEKGFTIQGLATSNDYLEFHAGTKEHNGSIVTNGGRVLAITGIGKDMSKALHMAYHGVGRIRWPGCNYRKDIGKDLLTLNSEPKN